LIIFGSNTLHYNCCAKSRLYGKMEKKRSSAIPGITARLYFCFLLLF